ncbi:MAG: hypothetical protein RIS76_2184 [Verrucomicrobiota bacterium]|jgi:hypothetical protein
MSHAQFRRLRCDQRFEFIPVIVANTRISTMLDANPRSTARCRSLATNATSWPIQSESRYVALDGASVSRLTAHRSASPSSPQQRPVMPRSEEPFITPTPSPPAPPASQPASTAEGMAARLPVKHAQFSTEPKDGRCGGTGSIGLSVMYSIQWAKTHIFREINARRAKRLRPMWPSLRMPSRSPAPRVGFAKPPATFRTRSRELLLRSHQTCPLACRFRS